MDYTLTSDIPYLPTNHPQHKLDLYTPTSTSSPPTLKPFPTIIYIHGGGFRFGSKVSSLLPLRLLSKGYALASLDYRLSGDAQFPAAIQDCRAAVSFLRANASSLSLDPENFIAMGESAGAYLALMVGLPDANAADDGMTYPEAAIAPFHVNGVIDFYGPTSFLEMDTHAHPSSKLRHNDATSPESLFLGAALPDVPDLVRRASPLTYITEYTPPVLIVHGTEDVIAPFHQSELLYQALRDKGREVELYSVEGADHIFQVLSEEERRGLDQAVGKDHVFVPLDEGQWRRLEGFVDGWLDGVMG